jgi:hypothetical protein
LLTFTCGYCGAFGGCTFLIGKIDFIKIAFLLSTSVKSHSLQHLFENAQPNIREVARLTVWDHKQLSDEYISSFLKILKLYVKVSAGTLQIKF